MKELCMVEFFSGIGGMRVAVESAIRQRQESKKKQPTAASSSSPQRQGEKNDNDDDEIITLSSCQAYDISLHANRTYQHNFSRDEKSVSTKLVEQLKSKDLTKQKQQQQRRILSDNEKSPATTSSVTGEESTSSGTSTVVLWTMSPPCQPFTKTRGAKGLDIDDKRCNGLKGIIQLLDTMDDDNHRPDYIFLENVKGFATSTMITKFYDCLERNGYTYKAYLIDPIQLGIPNHRQRFYLLCERSNRWERSKSYEEKVNESDNSPEGIATTSTANNDKNNANNNTRKIYTKPPKLEKNVLGSTTSTLSNRPVGDYLDTSISFVTEKEATESSSSSPQGRHSSSTYFVSKETLQQDWACHLGIVTAADTVTHCFTAGYGRIFHKATGSLLLLPPEEEDPSSSPPRCSSPNSEKNVPHGTSKSDTENEYSYVSVKDSIDESNDNDNNKKKKKYSTKPMDSIALNPSILDRTNMIQYYGRIRRFTPTELLSLFGFPATFQFPTNLSLEHQYKLIGNSINVTVVTELIKELLFFSEEDDNDDEDDHIVMEVETTTTTTSETNISTTANVGTDKHETNGKKATSASTPPPPPPPHIDVPNTVSIGGSKGHVVEEIPTCSHLYKLMSHQDYCYRWKMIPKCTGRYTCRDHKLVSHLLPLQMLQMKHITTIQPYDKRQQDDDDDDSYELTKIKVGEEEEEQVEEQRQLLPLQQYEFILPGRTDKVLVVPLDCNNLTGIITYVKSTSNENVTGNSDDVEGDDENNSNDAKTNMMISYVHTLNTPSGFRRKLQAIGIAVSDTSIAFPKP